MSPDKQPFPSPDKNISIGGDVVDSVVIAGDNNVVNKQTIFQKIINFILPTESETLEQRNRRILLGHVENAWIKGVLDASLHGAALLDLGIKQDPEAVIQYPWAIQKESTDETLPAGTSMLEIFDSIGMGRSLLILGPPGSGKTTMLLELARQLIQHAREDVTYPIPMVFNLSSWTESKTLADWLAQELNNLYSVPRKTAPDWVKGNKLLLLLDGLDEVRQESRAKCVNAINTFRKEHGLTSLAVCSRSQDYTDIKAKLSFEGAIEVQPLTQKQIIEFFNRFGKEMAGISRFSKDSALREMAETPLFLSIMIMAYQDKRDVEIWVSQDKTAQRKHLFDTYIERMFKRRIARTQSKPYKPKQVKQWLAWLAKKMIKHNHSMFFLENIRRSWLDNNLEKKFDVLVVGLIIGLAVGLVGNLLPAFPNLSFSVYAGIIFGIVGGLLCEPGQSVSKIKFAPVGMQAAAWNKILRGLIGGLIGGVVTILLWVLMLRSEKFNEGDLVGLIQLLRWACGFITVTFGGFIIGSIGEMKEMPSEVVTWSWKKAWRGFLNGISMGIAISIFVELFLMLLGLGGGLLITVMVIVPIAAIIGIAFEGWSEAYLQIKTFSNQGIRQSVKNMALIGLFTGSGFGLLGLFATWLFFTESNGELFMSFGLIGAMAFGVIFSLNYGGYAVVNHYMLRILFYKNGYMPLGCIPFLDYATERTFLRRVGGGYIFVHRLLMEHFAEMYVEPPTSKRN